MSNCEALQCYGYDYDYDHKSYWQVGTMKRVMEFFELPFHKISRDLMKKIKNKGRKNEVWPKTIQMLDKFFLPYNKRLASLLGDEKWLFIRETNPQTESIGMGLR